MAQRIGWLLLGFVIAIAVILVGGYLFVTAGGVPMAASASPLPLERTVARLALHASFNNARNDKDPLPLTDANLVAGAKVYRDNCVVCHGAPGHAPTPIASGMFPDPPQLFTPREMVTDDPEGITYWKVTNGIRLSGMPGFTNALSDTERWQVTMLLAHADKLPASVRGILTEMP